MSAQRLRHWEQNGEHAMKPLFAITSEFQALDAILDECQGDITDPRAEEAITAWVRELESDESAKMDGYIAYINKLTMEAERASALAAQYVDAAKTRTRRVEWLKSRMVEHMTKTGRKSIETNSGYTISVQANGGCVPLILDTVDVTKIDPAFTITKVELDKEKVREWLADGLNLPFAKLGERGKHLRIRV